MGSIHTYKHTYLHTQTVNWKVSTRDWLWKDFNGLLTAIVRICFLSKQDHNGILSMDFLTLILFKVKAYARNGNCFP